MYVTVLSPSITATPLDGLVTEVTVSVSPSTSESLASTSVVTGVSSDVVSVSSIATGTSLAAPTEIVTVAVSVPPLSSEIV